MLSIVLGAIYDVTPATALVELPSRVWSWLPIVFQMAFAMVFLVGQFVALFWFLSRGGIDTYMPEDIKTRFTDVWGQDHVLDRVKENMVFLEQPGVHRGQGRLRAPAASCCGARPAPARRSWPRPWPARRASRSCSSTPAPSSRCSWASGILKVKSLFRKLRKLALRYGGVIVFFDEADSLGNRGSHDAGTARRAGRHAEPVVAVVGQRPDHLRWLSPEAQSMLLSAVAAPSSLDGSPPAGQSTGS